MNITDTLNGLLNKADSTVRSFITNSLPKVIESITKLNEDELDSEIELALDHIRKAKGHSKIAKQLVAAVMALYACGYRTVEFAAAQLTKLETAKILDRALQFMSVYKLINRLWVAGLSSSQTGALAGIRKFFRQQFEGTAKPSAAKRAIFEHMLGFAVCDATYIHFVEGSKDDDGVWIVKPQLSKYEQSARLDAQKGTSFAEKAKFDATTVAAFDEEARKPQTLAVAA
jgi:hypothetical protein